MTTPYSIAVCTANVGGFDLPMRIPPQNVRFDFRSYNENNLNGVTSGWSNRMRSKYPKIQAHKLIPGYDIYIWIDSSVKVISPKFVLNFVRLLNGVDIVTTSHPDRKTIPSEFDFILKEISKGNPYLTGRYTSEEILVQQDFFRDNLPNDFPLFSAGISARWNNEKVNEFYNYWWDLVQRFGNYDQAAYSLALYKHNLSYRTIPFYNQYFRVGGHK